MCRTQAYAIVSGKKGVTGSARRQLIRWLVVMPEASRLTRGTAGNPHGEDPTARHHPTTSILTEPFRDRPNKTDGRLDGILT
nr:hypothetical protein [Kibdelosporangium sp. MJ126-NF4]